MVVGAGVGEGVATIGSNVGGRVAVFIVGAKWGAHVGAIVVTAQEEPRQQQHDDDDENWQSFNKQVYKTYCTVTHVSQHSNFGF